MPLLLNTSMQENPIGKDCYTGKRYNTCLLTVHRALEHKRGLLVRIAPCTRFVLWSLVAHI